mmetsp:Transcript_62899/g.150497  ORF Transcript_62899/g.150497 Transcript_62899/m.150497 type:complete len:139 (+) Transcript_62899:1-417(+)
MYPYNAVSNHTTGLNLTPGWGGESGSGFGDGGFDGDGVGDNASDADMYPYNAVSQAAPLAPTKALAVIPEGAPAPLDAAGAKLARPSPGHLLMMAHACTLAAVEGVLKMDLSNFSAEAAANAQAVTPIGGAVLRTHLC